MDHHPGLSAPSIKALFPFAFLILSSFRLFIFSPSEPLYISLQEERWSLVVFRSPLSWSYLIQKFLISKQAKQNALQAKSIKRSDTKRKNPKRDKLVREMKVAKLPVEDLLLGLDDPVQAAPELIVDVGAKVGRRKVWDLDEGMPTLGEEVVAPVYPSPVECDDKRQFGCGSCNSCDLETSAYSRRLFRNFSTTWTRLLARRRSGSPRL